MKSAAASETAHGAARFSDDVCDGLASHAVAAPQRPKRLILDGTHN
jgi:hypothetical protein